MKEEGRLDTTHNNEIPHESLEKILELLALLEQIMEESQNKNGERYKALIKELPVQYQNDYHKLLQFGAMAIIALHFARRGREGKL